MNILAYCAKSYEKGVKRAAGVVPLTCPPLRSAAITPRLLEGYDFLYFDLHGEPGRDWWQGDFALRALTAEQIREARLGGAIVFSPACFLGNDKSPMLDALLQSASCVVTGDGVNYGGKKQARWATALGLWFRRFIQWGMEVDDALRWGKLMVRLTHIRSKEMMDTMAFCVFRRGGGDQSSSFAQSPTPRP